MVRLTDRPDMTLDVYRGRKTTMQQQQKNLFVSIHIQSVSVCLFTIQLNQLKSQWYQYTSLQKKEKNYDGKIVQKHRRKIKKKYD